MTQNESESESESESEDQHAQVGRTQNVDAESH